jgi:uncharacterized membrane protein/glutaredoxin
VGKRAKIKRESKRETVVVRPLLRQGPNWALVVLSALGILLAAYLSWTEWTGSSVKGCSVGSSCDVVLSSRWAKLFGMPTAFWGMLAYVTLAATAFIKGAHRHWVTAWSFALFGVLYSAYLTTISLTVLHAACPYCLTSLALMTTIFAVVTLQRPRTLESFSWPRSLGRTAGVAAAAILLLHLHYTGVLGEAPAPEDPTARALAVHLTQSGVKMYGAFWCPHCQQQKEIFGSSAERLPYIECSPDGQNSPQASACRAEHIESYPTWVINGKHIEEVMTLKQLADATGFQNPAESK